MNRPNILWYCTDQQRFDTIAALGNPHVSTPVIDSLVKAGVAFTHAYCQSPICTPSRASVMSGQYPSRVHNTRNGNDTYPEERSPVISKLIADSGYDCGLIGKFHLQSSGKRTEPRLKDDGFRYWKFSHAPRDDWPGGEHDYADWVRENGGDLNAMRESEERVPRKYHQTTWATERAIEFISEDRPADQPWMLNINIYDPHPPFTPPKEYADQFSAENMPGPHFEESDLAAQAELVDADFQTKGQTPEQCDAHQAQADYYAMIKLIDDELGRLVQFLEDNGLRENTVIVFTSDHGETLGDNGLMFKGCRFYEGLIRVPLIFCHPSGQADVQSDSLVELLDLSATLLECAEVEIPDSHQGHSLLPVIMGKTDPDTKIRDFVRCEYFDALAPHFTGGNGTFATMYRDDRYKLNVYHSIDRGELFDLKNDPWEHNNLWHSPEHSDIRNELILRSFNAHVNLTTDVGSKRIAPM